MKPGTCLTLALASQLGCALFGLEHLRSPTRNPDKQGRTYAGKACDDVLFPLDPRASNDAVESDDLRHAALLTICQRQNTVTSSGHEEEQQPRFSPPYHRKLHETFDDRHPDPVVAALIVMACRDEICQHQENRVNRDDSMSVESHESGVGMRALYADFVNEDALRKRLVAIGLDEAAVKSFVGMFQESAKQTRTELAAMSEAERDFVYDGPRNLALDRQAYYKKHAKHYAALDALGRKIEQRGDKPEALADALRSLRSEYAQGCKTTCIHDLFYLEATRRLVLLHVAQQDALGVVAEADLLDDPESVHLPFSTALARVQHEREQAANVARERYGKAEKNGLQGATKDAVVGEAAPLHISYDALWQGVGMPAYRELVDAKSVGSLSDEIKAVKRSGQKAVVSFTVKKHKVEEPYACRRTNRVERIQSDGSLDYETFCKYRTKVVTEQPPDPVTVPADEAAGLRAGELIQLWTTKDQARVGRVTRDGTLVQWRADRFAAK